MDLSAIINDLMLTVDAKYVGWLLALSVVTLGEKVWQRWF